MVLESVPAAPAGPACPWLVYVPPGWPTYPPPPWWGAYPWQYRYGIEPALPRVWTVYVAWLAAMAAMLGGGVLIGIVYTIYMRATDPGQAALPQLSGFILSFWGLTCILLGNLASTGSASLIPAAFSRVPLRQRLALAAPAIGWTSTLALAIATSAVGHVLTMLVHLLGIPVGGTMADLMRSVAGFTAAEQLAMLAMIGLLVPITEELLFRGYIQTRLIERHGPLPGILIASALFGVTHMDLFQSPATFFLGLVLGFAAWYGRSIIPAIAGHMLNNLIAVGMMLLSNPEDEPSRRLAFIWLIGSALLVLLGFVWTLWRGRREVVLAE